MLQPGFNAAIIPRRSSSSPPSFITSCAIDTKERNSLILSYMSFVLSCKITMLLSLIYSISSTNIGRLSSYITSSGISFWMNLISSSLENKSLPTTSQERAMLFSLVFSYSTVNLGYSVHTLHSDFSPRLIYMSHKFLSFRNGHLPPFSLKVLHSSSSSEPSTIDSLSLSPKLPSTFL